MFATCNHGCLVCVEPTFPSPAKTSTISLQASPTKIDIPAEVSLDKREMLFIQQLEEKEKGTAGSVAVKQPKHKGDLTLLIFCKTIYLVLL